MTKVVKYYLDVRPIVCSNNQIEVGISQKLLKNFFFSPLHYLLERKNKLCYRTFYGAINPPNFEDRWNWVSVMTQWNFRSANSSNLRSMLVPSISNISYLLLLIFNIQITTTTKKERNG